MARTLRTGAPFLLFTILLFMLLPACAPALGQGVRGDVPATAEAVATMPAFHPAESAGEDPVAVLTGGLPSASMPDTEQQPASGAAGTATKRPAPHRFWDGTNDWLFVGVGVVRGLDFASTRNFRARHRNEILLNNQIVDNLPAFAAIEAGGVATSIGFSYLLHRTGHHSLERWLSIAHISITGLGVVRNYSLESGHPPQTPPAVGARGISIQIPTAVFQRK